MAAPDDLSFSFCFICSDFFSGLFFVLFRLCSVYYEEKICTQYIVPLYSYPAMPTLV